MRDISAQEITNVVEKLCVEACSQLPQQMANALKQAEKDETFAGWQGHSGPACQKCGHSGQ